MKIKKGDSVSVIAGKDKGKSGKVLKTFKDDNKVLVEGANISKKHKKPTKSGQSGQIIEREMPIHVSNVSLVDPKTGKPTKISIEREGGKIKRIAKKSGTPLG